MSRRLPVIRNLGGCGGTLLAQLFSALPGTLLLSETNPRSANLLGGNLNAIWQIRKWWPEFLPEVRDIGEREIGYPPIFGDMIERLHASTAGRGVQLIVRDYNYVDFIGIPFVWPAPGDSSLDAAVAGRVETQDFLFVRFPADQLASLRSYRPLARVLTGVQFLDGCCRFIDTYPTSPVFRYEDLAAAPESTFRGMCDSLGVLFAPEALSTFNAVTNVTGNTRRLSDGRIAAKPRSEAAMRIDEELSALPPYSELLERLGYTRPLSPASSDSYQPVTE